MVHERKYVLGTQLFIQGFREPAGNETLRQFHRIFALFEYLSAVVAQELRAGVKTLRDRAALERRVIDVFERTHRVITPSTRGWQKSGDVLMQMARKEGLEVSRVSKAFGNDILLALSCRESGCVLVTDNARDFTRIRKFVQFEFIAPWPSPASGVLIAPKITSLNPQGLLTTRLSLPSSSHGDESGGHSAQRLISAAN